MKDAADSNAGGELHVRPPGAVVPTELSTVVQNQNKMFSMMERMMADQQKLQRQVQQLQQQVQQHHHQSTTSPLDLQHDYTRVDFPTITSPKAGTLQNTRSFARVGTLRQRRTSQNKFGSHASKALVMTDSSADTSAAASPKGSRAGKHVTLANLPTITTGSTTHRKREVGFFDEFATSVVSQRSEDPQSPLSTTQPPVHPHAALNNDKFAASGNANSSVRHSTGTQSQGGFSPDASNTDNHSSKAEPLPAPLRIDTHNLPHPLHVDDIPSDVTIKDCRLSCPEVIPFDVAMSHNGLARRKSTVKPMGDKRFSMFGGFHSVGDSSGVPSFVSNADANGSRSATPIQHAAAPFSASGEHQHDGLLPHMVKNGAGEDGIISPVSPPGGERRGQDDLNNASNVQHRTKIEAPEQDLTYQLLQADESKSLGSDHWLATTADVCYIIMSTAVMFLGLTRLSRVDTSDTALAISLDLIVSLLTIVFAIVKSRTRQKVQEWEVIDDVESLRKRYLGSGWMVVDAITIVPLECIFISWAPVGFAICMQRHLLRLPRILTLYSSTNPLLESRQWFSIAFILCVTVLVAEVVTLIFYYADPENPDHLDAVYWTATTLTSVGYGDIVPTAANTKMLSIFVQIFGIITVSAITSVGTQFLTTKDPVRQDFEKRKKMMYSMLHFYKVPWEVQKEVIGLFPSVLANHNEDQFHELASNLPQVVAKKIEVFLRRKLIANVPLFRDLSEGTVLLEIAAVLDSLVYERGDYIITAGEEGREMFFVASGSVDVLIPIDDQTEKVVAVLRNGQWFGEIALIEDTVRTASVQAIETSEMLVLGKDAFLTVAMRNEKLRNLLNEEAAARRAKNESKSSPEKRSRAHTPNSNGSSIRFNPLGHPDERSVGGSRGDVSFRQEDEDLQSDGIVSAIFSDKSK